MQHPMTGIQKNDPTNNNNSDPNSPNQQRGQNLTQQNVIDAVDAFYAHRTNESFHQAERFLNEIADTANAFRICCNLFRTTSNANILFYCMHVFQKVIEKRYFFFF